MHLPQAMRFLIVGAFNTGVSYAVYALGLFVGMRFELANLLSCVAGVLVGFRTHGHFVFKDAHAPRLWKYFSIWIGLYVLNIGLIAMFVQFGLNAYVAGACATPLVVAVSYVLNRKVVFRSLPDVTDSSGPDPGHATNPYGVNTPLRSRSSAETTADDDAR